jgi:hypothetical protein
VIRALVGDDPNSFGVRIAIINQPEDGAYPREVLRIVGDEKGVHHFSWLQVEPMALAEPTMQIPAEFARALLDGLQRYFQGAEDTRALRQDYDAERKRVDKLTDALISIAGTRTVS